MKLEVDSVLYESFESARVDISLSTLSRAFVFNAVSTEGKPLPFKGGEPCKVFVDGEVVLTGNIEIVNVSYSSQEHTILLKGRSSTGDIVDSTLKSIELNPPISLASVIQKIISQLGLPIGVVDFPGLEDFNKAEDKIGPEVAENAFTFLENLARKRQVLLTTDGEQNVVIQRSEQQLISHQLLNVIGNEEKNNIIAGSVSYDHTKRYRNYLVKSQPNTSSAIFSGSTDLSTIADQGGSAQDVEVRIGRQLVIKAEKASSSEQAKERATWEGNIRKTRSAVYSATVLGYRTDSNDLWEINKLVQIQDDFADINARMLIDTISFSLDLQTGRRTTLGFVDKDAYKVELEEPEVTDKVGEGLFNFG